MKSENLDVVTLDLRSLPVITFIDEKQVRTTFHGSREVGRINAGAQAISGLVPQGSAVGIMLPTGLDLVRCWLSCLMAQVKPLIMQYKNSKQNANYWRDSVDNTVLTASIELIITDSNSWFETKNSLTLQLVEYNELSIPVPEKDFRWLIYSFEILQLSSGTTGFRKAITFTSKAILRHVFDYNEILNLTSQDKIVSWLPLYHDMGFIACFVMPLVVGTPIVLIDAFDWVRNPALLTDTICREGGSICYMPNFGFEVMTRTKAPLMPTMRLWISCSEPTSPATIRKFLSHTDSPAYLFASCYAMAENVFAISFGVGLETEIINGVEVASCGLLVPGVAVHFIDDNIWVRSPTSLTQYLGHTVALDDCGFYSTGDIGVLINNQLFVCGRRNDVLIQAGRKFLLSDIDITVNRLRPDIRGRAATVAIYSRKIGTEIACVLIEAKDFFYRGDDHQLTYALKEAHGIDQVVVHYVPPRFLTKTTSGKFNRRQCASDWAAVESARMRGDTALSPINELRETFRSSSWTLPAQEVLDSLSITIVQLLAAQAGVTFEPHETLDDLEAKMLKSCPIIVDSQHSTIRIVSLAERELFANLSDKDLDEIGAEFGCHVTFEHVCLPPSALTLSDLIFQEYFQPRLDRSPFTSVNFVLDKVRDATILIVDDGSELFYLPEQVYGVLSHNIERDPRSDLISIRWQAYAANHHRLPLAVVRGGDIPLSNATKAIADLSNYLATPIFRIANFAGFAEFTGEWDWRPLRGNTRPLDGSEFTKTIVAWLKSVPGQLRKSAAVIQNRIDLSDAIHYCSHAIKQAPLDQIINSFEHFAVAGRASSVPYIYKRVESEGKTAVTIPSYAPEVVSKVAEAIECILICGAMGNFPTTVPTIALQHVGQSWRAQNFEMLGDEFAGIGQHGVFEDMPESGLDWFISGPLEWGRDREKWLQVRLSLAAHGCG